MNSSNECKKLYDAIDWKSLSVLPTGCNEIKDLLRKIENLQSVCIRLKEPIPALVNLWIKKLKKNECASGTQIESVKVTPVVPKAQSVVSQAQPVVTKVQPVVSQGQTNADEPPNNGYIIIDGKIKYGKGFDFDLPYTKEEKELYTKNGWNDRDMVSNGNLAWARRNKMNEVKPNPLTEEEKEKLRKNGFIIEELPAMSNEAIRQFLMNETALTAEEIQQLEKNGWDPKTDSRLNIPSNVRNEYLKWKKADYDNMESMKYDYYNRGGSNKMKLRRHSYKKKN
jgi:hypothetical protein